MLKLNPLEKLELAKPRSDRIIWKQRFERFRYATKLNKEDEILQINNTHIYKMGKEAEHIFKVFTFGEGDEKKYAKVFEKFDDQFIPRGILFMSERAFIVALKKKEKL